MLDSKSTFEDVLKEYNDTASYSIDADIAKAKRFEVACRFILNPMFLPLVTEHSGERTELFLEAVERQLKDAQDFVVEGGDVPGDESIYVSFENARR